MFSSIFFLPCLLIFWLLYLVIPKNSRKTALLMISYLFCGFLSWKALLCVIIVTVSTFYAALYIESSHNSEKKQALGKGIAISVCLCIILFMLSAKYDPMSLGLFLPIGFSFYAFQAIGYISDVSARKTCAEKNFISYALYMNFFAKFVSGPIEKKDSFTEQVESLPQANILNMGNLSLAVTYILWGYCQKMIIADRLALLVNMMYDAPDKFDSVWLAMGAVLYSFQIYADFCGYTDIAIGCALLFGIRLSQNFASPYWSKNITEFWRRWHISLSTWLKEYIYIPLGGNRKGVFRKYINTLVVFLVCGIWHGENISFVVWGLLHGVFSIISGLTARFHIIKTSFLQRIITFISVTFAWIFFRADTLHDAVIYISSIVKNGLRPGISMQQFLSEGFSEFDIYLVVFLVLFTLVVEIVTYNKASSFPVIIQHRKSFTRYMIWIFFLLLIFVFGIYGRDMTADTFIYMQF